MRRRLSISDILQIASAIFFIIVPIINLEASYDQEKGIGGFFIIYTSFSWLLLAYEWLRSRNSKRVTIIDITSYLERYRDFKLKLSGQIFLLISLALVFFIYIPSQALVLRFEDSSIQAQPYEQAMTVQVLRAIYFLVGFIIILACLLDFKHRRRDVFNLTLLTLLVVCALLGVRRDLIYLVIMTSITFYALNRGRVTKKSLGVAASLFAIILFIYFPIYNIIRVSPVKFDRDAPIESITQIINYGISAYDSNIEKASEGTEKRSLMLFETVSGVINTTSYTDYSFGALTIKAIDHAIPRFLNPNKGEGIEKEVERLGGFSKDVADSILVTGVAECGLLGGGYTVIFFILFFHLSAWFSSMLERLASSRIVGLYILYSLIYLCWSVEITMSAFISWFFISIPSLSILLLMEKAKLIYAVDHTDPKTIQT